MEEEQRKRDYERLQGLEASQAELAAKFQRQQEQIDSLSQQRGSQQLQQLADDPALDTTAPSMPRSSVGSAPGDEALLDIYHVDDIMDNTNCELHFKMKNISTKVADGFAYTNPPEATFHCNPIPAGYARVGVDEVVAQYSGLELDIPRGDDERTLGESIHRIIIWRKDCIIFPRSPTPRQPAPPPSPPPCQQTPAPPTPPTTTRTPLQLRIHSNKTSMRC